MKERLTGAIIVVALLVLLVPELLTGPEPRSPAQAAGAEGTQLRSYTIDLQADGTGQPGRPMLPGAAVSEDPVGEATPDGEAASPPVASVTAPVDDATRAQGRPMGSGADSFAAAAESGPSGGAKAPADSAKVAGSSELAGSSSASAEDERPRSAFGPNARPQPAPTSAGKADSATASSKAAAAKAEAQKAESAKAEATRAEAARTAASKPAATQAGGSKGWAVQLGVFGNRDNADRLARQVKGSGFPVLLSESSGKDGKKLYWVRVGPAPDHAAAVALSARLKAAGHRETRVVAYP